MNHLARIIPLHRHQPVTVAGVRACRSCGRVLDSTEKHGYEWREWERLLHATISDERSEP